MDNDRDQRKQQLYKATEESPIRVTINDENMGRVAGEVICRRRRLSRSSIYDVKTKSPEGKDITLQTTVDSLSLGWPVLEEKININGEWQKGDEVRLTGFEEGAKHKGFNGLVGIVREQKDKKYFVQILDPQPEGGVENFNIGDDSAIEIGNGVQEIPAGLKKVRNSKGNIVISLSGNRLQKYEAGALPSYCPDGPIIL
jgi:hypothetical protein